MNHDELVLAPRDYPPILLALTREPIVGLETLLPSASSPATRRQSLRRQACHRRSRSR